MEDYDNWWQKRRVERDAIDRVYNEISKDPLLRDHVLTIMQRVDGELSSIKRWHECIGDKIERMEEMLSFHKICQGVDETRAEKEKEVK